MVRAIFSQGMHVCLCTEQAELMFPVEACACMPVFVANIYRPVHFDVIRAEKKFMRLFDLYKS